MFDRIKQLRIEHNLTQQEIADALGISLKKYDSIETGRRPLTGSLLFLLAKYYRVSADYILEQTDERTPYST